jgi:hypothetical protein
MTETITVVEEATALDDAYGRGYSRFSGLDPRVAEDAEPARITDSAAWANHIAPTLRCMAGFRDGGHGTWQIDGDIALIVDGDESDHPADAEVIQASMFHQDVIDAWYEGAYAAIDDALDGRGERP